MSPLLSTSLPFMCLIVAAAACGPGLDPSSTESSTGSGTSSTDSPTCDTEGCVGSTTTSSDATSTSADPSAPCASECGVTTGADPGTETDTETDTGVIPSQCAPGAGDLSLVWNQVDPMSERGEAVAVGAGRVAWLAGNWDVSQLRVLDVDGDLLWEQAVPLQGGEAELTFKDLAIDPAGAVVLAGTTIDHDGVVRWFDSDGDPLMEDTHTGAGQDQWSGLALLGDGALVVAGASAGDMMENRLFVRRYAASGLPAWSQPFSEMGAAWSSDVSVTATGTILVSGHSNKNPGPVLLAYAGDGSLKWSHIDPGEMPQQLAWSVAADSEGRALLAVSVDEGGRVDRFDATGALESSIPLDFMPRSIAVDVDDNLVIAGWLYPMSGVVVERRDPEGALLARHERPGQQALGLVVDADCHAYVVGHEAGSAWLDKLN